MQLADVANALAESCAAPPEEDEKGFAQAVPQKSAALEAAASVGQSLRKHYIGTCPAALDSVLSITAALSAVAGEKASEVEKVRQVGADNKFSDPKNPDEQKKNGASISPWVHAHIGLARLGIGEDAFGRPLRDAVADGRTLNLSLIDGGRMTFTVRAT